MDANVVIRYRAVFVADLYRRIAQMLVSTIPLAMESADGRDQNVDLSIPRRNNNAEKFGEFCC
jgi:hypothetical protein